MMLILIFATVFIFISSVLIFAAAARRVFVPNYKWNDNELFVVVVVDFDWHAI